MAASRLETRWEEERRGEERVAKVEGKRTTGLHPQTGDLATQTEHVFNNIVKTGFV